MKIRRDIMLDSHLTRCRLQRRLQRRRVTRVTRAVLACDADGSAVGITRVTRAVLAPCSRRARAGLAPCSRRAVGITRAIPTADACHSNCIILTLQPSSLHHLLCSRTCIPVKDGVANYIVYTNFINNQDCS